MRPVKSTAALLLVIAFAFAAPGGAAAEDTAMFRSDAAHNGLYQSQAPGLSTVEWRFTTKGKIMSSPVVAGGIVFVGSFDGRLYAVRATDGSLVWSFKTKGPVNSSPAVANGMVFFGSIDGNVYAVGADDGRERWHFATLGEQRYSARGIHGIIPRSELMPDPFDVLVSSPSVADGTVYIGSGDHHVYALDATTGKLRWSFETGNVVHASPAVYRGTVYIGSWDRYMYALDARTGAVRWKFITGDDQQIFNQVGIVSSAAVANDTVYFGCRDSFFYAVDARTGQLRWKHNEHGSWVIGSPALADGSVFYTTSDEKRFWALDAASGAERFNVAYGAFSFSSPSIAGRAAYFGTFDGRLYAVNINTGKVIATFSTDASRANLAPHLDANGNLEINELYTDATLEGIIVGLDRVYSLGSIVGSPAIDGGVLYIGSTDGKLYALH